MDPLMWIAVFIGAGAIFSNVGADAPAQGVLTPQRDDLFKRLMRGKYPTAQLREAADQFDKQGLKVQATYLRKRAASRELPKEQLEARRALVRQFFACTEPAKVRDAATACEREGMLKIAKNLREYASTLDKKGGAAAA